MMKLPRKVSATGWLVAGQILLASLWLTGCSTLKKDEPAFTEVPVEPATYGTPAVDSTNPSTTNSGASTAGSGDRFAVDDQVIVNFSGVQEPPPPHDERIKEDGTITLPIINAVKAAGKTSGELQKEIHDLYVPKYYVSLTVTVKTQDRFFYVSGQVKAAGRIAWSSGMTVMRAIAAAGDFTDFANKKKVRLTHPDGKSKTINCDKIQNDPSLDLPVYPGDKIHVPQRLW